MSPLNQLTPLNNSASLNNFFTISLYIFYNIVEDENKFLHVFS